MPDGGQPFCDCKECDWKGMALKLFGVAATAPDVARTMAANGEAQNDAVKRMQGEAETLLEENGRLARANKELNAAGNGIKAVPRRRERVNAGRRGRPPGQKPTINRRPQRADREAVADVKVCPKCRKSDCSPKNPRTNTTESSWCSTSP